MAVMADEEECQLIPKIAKILEDAATSNATHNRKLKELSTLRSKTATSSPSSLFFSAFCKTLIPLFTFERRSASAERVVRFVSAFATAAATTNSDAFLEEFLRFLLAASAAANRTVRFRACQIFSEIIMRLPDDAEVTDELWDEIIECLKIRVGDKITVIRTCAIRALSRFASDSENRDVLDLLLEVLPQEPSAEVRKTILLSLPASSATSQAIIDCTLDVSESVRKTAYFVLADKFPLQSLSIKLRTVILQRGLSDRSAVVSKECLKLLKEEWLTKCCNGDVVEFVKYLDVETYESVGESVMRALLEAGLIQLREGESIQQYISSGCSTTEVDSTHITPSIQLMEAEDAFYWKMVCRHLQKEAQTKGSDAASTMGTEAAVYAAEASMNNDLLDSILPATISDYIVLVKAHMDAGSTYRFASRQLLLIGAILDFSDYTNRRVASEFVLELLLKPFDHEVDDVGNMVVLGDGINLGGDRDWAIAVSGLARKVHAANGEFEEVILGVIQKLAQPCRERVANFMQWMHCVAVIGLLLENTKSVHSIQGKAIEPSEILQSILLPAAKHVHLDVQRIAARCLGLFGLLEKKPSKDVIKHLRLSFVNGPVPISIMASKALVDIGMWHNPHEVDEVWGEDLSSELENNVVSSSPSTFSDERNVKLLDFLYAGLKKYYCENYLESDENESVPSVLGEGFAKILLLSENYPSLPSSLHPSLLVKLINLYFSSEAKDLQRLRQCLSVFFVHYTSLSANHKKYLSKAFIPVMRSMWPGIDGNAGGSSAVVSNMRKCAIQASWFMLQMLQAPLYKKENGTANQNGSSKQPETEDDAVELEPPLECGDEGLAIRIASEVASFPKKKTPAEKAYISAMIRILVLLNFRLSEQEAIQLMRRLLIYVTGSFSTEKDLLKELKRMADQLKAKDRNPDQDLVQDQADLIFERLGIELNLDLTGSVETLQTPAPPSTRQIRGKRQRKRQEESSEDESSPTSVVPDIPTSIGRRSERASKTAALSKMNTIQAHRNFEDVISEEDESELTSDESSDESDEFAE